MSTAGSAGLEIEGLRQSATAGHALIAGLGPDAPVRDQARLALEWAQAEFDARFVVASSMGDEVLVHLAAQHAPGVDVAFLDTGYHFAETLGLRDAIASTYDVSVRSVEPLLTVTEQDSRYGPNLHDRDPDRCCALRKVEPLERTLREYDAWATGMRRVDAPTRKDIEVIGWDAKRDLVKLNPLASWTDDDIDDYATEHSILLNPLRQLGYASIGCLPCTRAVSAGEEARAGRWSGTAKTECGLHR